MAMLKDVSAFFIALAQDLADMEMGDAMTNLRLQKMLYYAQGWMLKRHGITLFSEPVEAWQYGPVIPVCYNWYKGFGSNPLKADMPARAAFTADEYEVMLDTWDELSKYSTAQLVTMTHEAGTPWDRVWNHSKEREITTESIKQYFAALHLTDTKEKLDAIPTLEPLYRENGIPVFSHKEVWANVIRENVNLENPEYRKNKGKTRCYEIFKESRSGKDQRIYCGYDGGIQEKAGLESIRLRAKASCV